MRYKIHFWADMKRVFFPFDGIRILSFIVATIMFAGMLFVVTGNFLEDNMWFPDVRIQILFSIMWVIFVIVVLISITQLLCKYTLSNFFSNFNGEFEKRFAYGFRILVIGFIVGVFWNVLENIPIMILISIMGAGSIDFTIAEMSISIIWNIGGILISLYILYGFLVLVSATKFYKPIMINSKIPLPESGRQISVKKQPKNQQ